MLDLGFESLTEDELDISLEEFYEKEIELKDMSNHINSLIYEAQTIVNATGNVVSIEKIIEQETSSLSPEFKKLVPHGFGSIDDVDYSTEKLAQMALTGVEKLVYLIRKIVAWVKDFFRKYLTFQRIRQRQLKKKISIVEKLEYDTIKNASYMARYGKAVCDHVADLDAVGEAVVGGKFYDTLEYMADQSEQNDTSAITIFIKGYFHKIATKYARFGILAELDIDGTMIATKKAYSMQTKTVEEFGYSSKQDILDTLNIVLTACEDYMNNPRLSKKVDELNKGIVDMRQIDDIPYRLINLTIVHGTLKVYNAVVKYSGQVLTDVEKSVLAIPTK